MPRKRYVVTDGKLVLELYPAEEGGYTVRSPMDPELITEGDTIEESFAMAYDALKCLRIARQKHPM
jgi:predicted RNase H-like HicB family nuclease